MVAPRKERKVVTVLFADLVGFTARAESLDPEDVEAILGPYHARLRSELERFGGTVEKFIGDAVMALFGAPVAHEDDPERAVRAALAIRDWARESGDVQVRVAVNTGEALVNLAARTELGEGTAAGDVVNTTARLQTAAPVNGVLVGETTYRATRHVIDYSDAEAVEAKGKAVPIAVWEANATRARVGSEAVSRRAPLVGRERERDQLVGAFERARQESATQFVTLVGVPGIGKSRLVSELLEYVETLPELVYWRHGRSLPYGDGVTFWAFAEMVKAQAGIVENDPAEDAERKLHEAVADVVGERERAWVEANLRPLVGLDDATAGGTSEDAAAAWRNFLEALAEQHPLVLVFEDLHWADDALLDFVDELPDWSVDVPLLVLATARSELLTRRPGWGGGKRNGLTISLSPLEPDETAKLIATLLDRAVLPAETQAALLERAGGNPLYAEQFVRMLAERGNVGAALPETVQSIIAARLDALPEPEKALLQDAAVVGKVFWTGALAVVNGAAPETIEQHLRSLARKDFVRRERRATVEGESEYAFTHILVQDVAYGQIPRRTRAERHRRAAEWIEALGRDQDQAELLAHHYASALDLLQAAGSETDELAPRARTALRAAGARALGLYAYPSAVRWFEAAAAITVQPDPDRARAMLQHALALHPSLDPRRFDLLEEARTALLEEGDVDGAAEAGVALAEAWWWVGDRERCIACLEQASVLVRDDGSDLARPLVLSQVARFQTLRGEHERAVETAVESLHLAERVGRPDLRAKNLITLGTARAYLPSADTAAAADDIRAGNELAESAGSFDQLSRGLVNLATVLNLDGRVDEALAAMREAARLAHLRGHRAGIRFTDANLLATDLERGEWAAAEQRAAAFLQESEESPHFLDTVALAARATLAVARAEPERAVEDVERLLAIARKVRDPQTIVPALATAALVYAELDLTERSRETLHELVPGPHIASVPDAHFAAARIGAADQWRERIAPFANGTPWNRAADAVLGSRWREAADAYDEIGVVAYAALAALRGADAALAAGNRAEADALLARALAFYRSVGATRFVRAGERLLAATA
jgi:class 3 adenylate cyclase/tetratricopeptide (TPR) repeat protein